MGKLKEQNESKSHLFFSFFCVCAQSVDYEVSMIRVSWKLGHNEEADARSHRSHPLNHKSIILRRFKGSINVAPENKQ